jgi:hypothetical protein
LCLCGIVRKRRKDDMKHPANAITSTSFEPSDVIGSLEGQRRSQHDGACHSSSLAWKWIAEDDLQISCGNYMNDGLSPFPVSWFCCTRAWSTTQSSLWPHHGDFLFLFVHWCHCSSQWVRKHLNRNFEISYWDAS